APCPSCASRPFPLSLSRCVQRFPRGGPRRACRSDSTPDAPPKKPRREPRIVDPRPPHVAPSQARATRASPAVESLRATFPQGPSAKGLPERLNVAAVGATRLPERLNAAAVGATRVPERLNAAAVGATRHPPPATHCPQAPSASTGTPRHRASPGVAGRRVGHRRRRELHHRPRPAPPHLRRSRHDARPRPSHLRLPTGHQRRLDPRPHPG